MGFRDRVAESKKGNGYSIPDGVYKTKFKDWERTKSFKSGDDMWVIKFKIVGIKSLEDAKKDHDVVMEEIVDKKKQIIEMKLLTRLSFHFDRVLEFLNDVGCDLDSIDESDETLEGIEKLFEQVEDNTPPACEIFVSTAKDEKSKNYYFNHITNTIGENIVSVEGVEYKWNDLVEQGWSVEQIEAAINPNKES